MVEFFISITVGLLFSTSLLQLPGLSFTRFFLSSTDARATQWEDPRLEKLGGPAVPYSRNYRQKYEYFRSRLRAPRDLSAKFEIRVTRSGIFEDSFRLIYSVKKPEILMHR